MKKSLCRFNALAAAVLAVSCVSCAASAPAVIESETDGESAITAQSVYDETDGASQRTVHGELCYLTDDYFSVKTSEGIIDYGFDEIELNAPEYGLLLGASVDIVYETVNGEETAARAVVGKVEYADEAYALLTSMTTEEKVGQMFYARYPSEGATDDIASMKLGGYILFGRDFESETPDGIRAKLLACQNASKLGMFIGVDEEGGTVNRVSRYAAFRSAPFKSPRELYADGGMELIVSDTAEKTALLSSLGINVNMAPVCDISTGSGDFMYDRSLGENADVTSDYVTKVVQTMSDGGIASVLKHFPGYGDTSDTHTGIAYDERDYSAFVSSDFKPFIAGVKAGANMVLVSHNIVECMDSERPASLSEAVHKQLRQTIGFYGPIMTDDLSMDAIRDFAIDEDAAVMAVLAGNDLICCTDYKTQYPAVLAAVNDGTISRTALDRSVMRILICKYELQIIV